MNETHVAVASNPLDALFRRAHRRPHHGLGRTLGQAEDVSRRYGMTDSQSYGRRARARDRVAEAAYDSRVDTARGVRTADEKEPVMSEPITYVGIDAHKVELHVALLAADETELVTWTVRNEVRAVKRLRRKLERVAPDSITCCYEAGPCGYALQRQLDRGRVRCEVIAPALVPRKKGERIKTDRAPVPHARVVFGMRRGGCPDGSAGAPRRSPPRATSARGDRIGECAPNPRQPARGGDRGTPIRVTAEARPATMP